jgi:SAM-dependent methyltransferase
MDEVLEIESSKLAKSWMQHEAAWLRDYLVAGVEDPRVNVQSVFSRHFLIWAITGDKFRALMDEECRFAAVMNWLASLARRAGQLDELETVLHALRQGADNAEGTEIPPFVLQAFRTLPARAGDVGIPNYIESGLSGAQSLGARCELAGPSLDTFGDLWQAVLAGTPQTAPVCSVFEPACGSANDYRFLNRYGIASRIHYTGIDLCAKNIENARALFPGIQFLEGNVFEIDAPDKSFDLCFVHDLFEHLSLEGMRVAVGELCRVSRQGLCLGFFNLDEVPEHVVRPVDDYYWNTLSLPRMRELFNEQGFAAQVFHIGTFLRQKLGCDFTHNPKAYTLLMEPRRAPDRRLSSTP